MDTALLITGYVQVEPELRLPKALQAAEDHVRRFDADLRLRVSLKRELRQAGCGYILERKARRGAVTHTETKVDLAGTPLREADPDVRVASRDGYVVISNTGVHITRLIRPDAIIEELRKGDHADKSGEQRFRELVAGQAADLERRWATRKDNDRGFFRESFDTLERMGGVGGTERHRMNNAGGEERLNVVDRRRVTPEGFPIEGSSAGEIPAQESSDGHTSRAADPS